ncbi:MAG: DUF2865 domain-containing protein [Bauldia sp.]|nr:DUF2865 domain-containing protein [Bauldia sp.]
MSGFFRHSRWRRWTRGLAFGLGVAFAVPAAAQNYCAQLEQQLAALQQGQSDRQYQNLAAQYQQAQVAYNQTYQAAQQQGCIRVIQRLVPATCAGILGQLQQMAASMDALARQMQTLPDPGSRAADINNVLRALGNAQCGPQYAPYADRPGDGRLLDRLFGNEVMVDPNVVIGAPASPAQQVATYTTVCVRYCDGSFFPISFSTTQSRFSQDAATCQARCPGQQVGLFTYRAGAGSIDNATSVDGLSYASLANAFVYRETYNPSCGCGPLSTIVADDRGASVVTVDLSQGVQIAAGGGASYPPIPRERPDPSEDPETLANRQGGFIPGAMAPPDLGPVALVNDEGMRLIGPAYLFAR